MYYRIFSAIVCIVSKVPKKSLIDLLKSHFSERAD